MKKRVSARHIRRVRVKRKPIRRARLAFSAQKRSKPAKRRARRTDTGKKRIRLEAADILLILLFIALVSCCILLIYLHFARGLTF